VAVAGSHVLAGYLNDPDAERLNKIRDGGRVWHRTGDAAWVDGQGRLWLMGRVGERVRRDGQTWWGGAAEARALDVPSVHHAAYLGIDDAELGQRAVLCVETASGTLTPAEQDAIRAALGPMPLDEVRAACWMKQLIAASAHLAAVPRRAHISAAAARARLKTEKRSIQRRSW
jgi:acyl-CoA synthetase (AMP-forming)/AMP-acid ligase II